MTCFPCAVAKRDVELRLADAGADPAYIVAQTAATLCLMCALEQQQTARPDPAGA
ncbi:MAG TPA: hypothetical protein VFR49_09575 [Solirubrobacteraceae bacterium]|nr:hypothetical protein [Solirubrobacteraceae bacterium]